MRYFIFSDVHANIFALEKVVEKAKKEGYDKAIFLGDIVGYGTDPQECTIMVKSTADVIIMGNHDRALIVDEELTYFNPVAREAILWTRKRLEHTPQKKIYSDMVQNNKYIEKIEDGLYASHAAFKSPEFWDYIIGEEDAFFQFEDTDFRILLVGHTHVPSIFSYEYGEVSYSSTRRLKLESDKRYILNPGAVGQPRDGDPRASFAILDTKIGYFELFRVEYDVQEEVKRIKQFNLPETLHIRLQKGR